MKYFMLSIVSSVLLSSNYGLAQVKRVLPLPPPQVTCISNDGLWQLLVNQDKGTIRVVDVKRKTLSITVSGLLDVSKMKVLRLYNFKGKNDLPEGIVFEANLNLQPNNNGYGINDYSGKKTIYSCHY